MKELEFAEFTNTYEDADGDEHQTTTRAHVVTKDTAREVTVRGMGQVNVGVGTVLVETDRPGVYDTISKKDWDASGYMDASAPTAVPTATGGTEVDPITGEPVTKGK